MERRYGIIWFVQLPWVGVGGLREGGDAYAVFVARSDYARDVYSRASHILKTKVTRPRPRGPGHF